MSQFLAYLINFSQRSGWVSLVTFRSGPFSTSRRTARPTGEDGKFTVRVPASYLTAGLSSPRASTDTRIRVRSRRTHSADLRVGAAPGSAGTAPGHRPGGTLSGGIFRGLYARAAAPSAHGPAKRLDKVIRREQMLVSARLFGGMGPSVGEGNQVTRHTFRRGSLATIIGLALSVSAVPLVAPAHADTATEITVPATMGTTPRTAYPQSAGASGFLEYRSTAEGYGLWWTGYDGSRKPVEGGERLGPRTPGAYGTGSDVVALRTSQGSGGQVLLRDMGTGTTGTVVIPADQSYMQTYGRTVLTGTSTGGERTRLFLLHNENGSTVQKPVTGLPDGTVFPFFPKGSTSGLLVNYNGPDQVLHYAWVDAETGAATILPSPVANIDTVVGSDYLVSYSGSRARVYAQGAYDAPSHEVAFPHNSGDKILGVVGDALVVARRSDSSVWSVSALPFDGSAELPLFKRADPAAFVTPDGGLVLAGGESSLDYGIAKVEAGADGLPRARRIVGLPAVPIGIESLDLSGGELMTYESGDGATHLYSRSLVTAGALTAGTRTDRGATQRCGVMAGDRGSCPDLMGTGDGRAVIRNTAGEVSVLDRGQSLPSTVLASGLQDNHGLVDVEGRYAAWRGPSPAGDGLMVADLDTRKVVRTRTGAAGAVPSALWGKRCGRRPGTAVSRPRRCVRATRSRRSGWSAVAAAAVWATSRRWDAGCTGPAGAIFPRAACRRPSCTTPAGRRSSPCPPAERRAWATASWSRVTPHPER